MNDTTLTTDMTQREQTSTRTDNIRGGEQPFQHQSFKNPSAWQPPPNAPLEFISKNKLDLVEPKIPPPGRNNISRDECKAIKDLANNHNIVIKPADKGGAVVIQDKDSYIQEGIRQLSDQTFYKEVDSDLSNKHHHEIKVILDQMYSQGQIDRSCYLYLTDEKICTAEFYMLPKIHKNKTLPPGRPIVSGNSCPTERISKLIDHFLQPNVKNIRSYVKDTSDFLHMLNNLGTLPPNCILATLDVSSLYTNIPNREGRLAAEMSLNASRGDANNPSNTHLLMLLDKVLNCNNFNFNGRHFLQVGGTAMGTKVAPAYANTFMGWYEDKHVYTYRKQPLLWKRFIDDMFVIWQYSQEDLKEFVSHLNTRMQSIKFEADTSTVSVNFLDVTIIIDPEGNINTTLYTKPTDSHNYINYQFCHQKACKNEIPYGQFLRLRRICSDEDDFISKSKVMAYHFHNAGYPNKLIQESFERAFFQDRDALLIPKPDTKAVRDDNKLFLITTHHPPFRGVNNIVSKNKELLDKSSSTRPILQAEIIHGFRRCKNLPDLLVCAKLQPDSNQGNNPGMTSGSNKCGRPFCLYCKKLNRSGRIRSTITNRSYTTRTNVSCRCTNLIYAIECLKYGKIYVGQTKRRLMDRLIEHIRNIRQSNDTHIVGRHFNSHNHNGLNDISVYILDFIHAHPDSLTASEYRDIKEKMWIYRLRSQTPIGLNLFD